MGFSVAVRLLFPLPSVLSGCSVHLSWVCASYPLPGLISEVSFDLWKVAIFADFLFTFFFFFLIFEKYAWRELCVLQHVLVQVPKAIRTSRGRGCFPVFQASVLQCAVQGRPLHLQTLVATRSHYVITYVFWVYVIYSMDILNVVLGGKERLFHFFLPSNYSTNYTSLIICL